MCICLLIIKVILQNAWYNNNNKDSDEGFYNTR